jgi:Ca2+-binding RTX toxin-like protein
VCTYDSTTHSVAVLVTPSNDFAPGIVVVQGDLVIDDGDGGSDCGAATVTNTDTIAISNASDTEPFGPFHVLGAFTFAPGFSDESGSSDEIEFSIDFGPAGGEVDFDYHSSTSPINVAAGKKQINLNAAESDGIDADVTISGSKGVINFLDTEFADVIDAGGGGAGVPAQPFIPRVFFLGYVLDTGADVFIGGAGNDDILGVGGDDHLEGGAGNDQIQGFGGNDLVRGGPGVDFIFGQGGADLLHGNGGADDVEGGPAADRLFGDAGADDLAGQGGNDAINGGPDNDSCSGGPGADTFAACETAHQ